ncbi:hypothetical protein Chor_010752 [Crotalus horridus]
MVKQLAKLPGWQDTLTKLYVKESYESRQHSLSNSANSEQSSMEKGKELVGSTSPLTSELPDLDVFLPLGYEASDHELSEGFLDLSMSPTNQKNKVFQSYAFKSFDSLELASHSSSSNIMDLSGQGEVHPGGPADRVYHPLSPFSNSPYDLGLDFGSSSSAATMESGNQTPLSLPGTPSPLENFKPFPGSRARKSSSLSNQTPEEELCNLLTNIIFSVTWRGVEGWDDVAWKERGQVFSVLTKLGSACELVRPPDEIKRSLLEMMMESALTDLKQTTPVLLPSLTQNALKLLHLLQDFLFSEGHNNQVLWSEKIYEGANSLLDKLGVWYHLANGTSDLKEMAQIGLRVLIGYIMLEDIQLQSLAYVKLHGLLQTASAPRKEQACYLLGKLETPLRASLHTKSETFSWLVPIIRTLMDQCYDTLQLQHFLPSLPPTNGSPTFYEDFQVFCTHPEWLSFIEKHVQPTMAQFEMDTFAKSHDHMSNFWNSCYDALMSSNQRREKEKAESRRKFQPIEIHELSMFSAPKKPPSSRLSPSRNPPEIRWKLSNVETYSRMRLKLVPNHHFDLHAEASALRDNLGEKRFHEFPRRPPASEVARQVQTLCLSCRLEAKEQNQREKLLISEDCELITVVAVIPGRLEVTTQQIYFYDSSSEKEETEDGEEQGLLHHPQLAASQPDLPRQPLPAGPAQGLWTDSVDPFVFLLQKWVYREISNFEYLIQLNTIAGRTYNDLSQYPVFPWILQDYLSETLDLNNPAVFRDLYESFEDPTGMIDKFHYGTHYSNAAGVMHYLIRTEPFTTLHIQLQSGRFDCSDRQFHSVPAAWQARLENPVDVKELIPEFFYFTDFLENQNGFDLGSLQISNEKVTDVVLPKWAKSPEDFIHKHRQALESEYVSAHLHEWIDLIFGYKQRGPAAVEALNVFYYCTYEVQLRLKSQEAPGNRLNTEPHPARFSAENAARRLSRLDTYSPNIFENLDQLKSFFAESISERISLVQVVVPKNQSHSFITQGSPDMMITVSANGLLGTHSWLPYDKNISNYFSFTKDSTVSNPKTQRYLYGPFAPGAELSSKTLVVSHDGKLLFSGGHWDNSLRVTSLSKGKVIGHINRHIGRDPCVLYGHEDEVTCVGISTELDMAVSGSKDGTILVHTIRRGQFMMSLKPPCECSLPVTISNLVVGHQGQIVVQTVDKFALHLYSVNGKHLSSVPLDEQVTSMCVTEDFVVLGTLQCSLQIKDLQRLQPAVPSLIMKVPIHSVSVTKEKSHILVGLEDGKLIVLFVIPAGHDGDLKSPPWSKFYWCGRASSTGGSGAQRGVSPRCLRARQNTIRRSPNRGLVFNFLLPCSHPSATVDPRFSQENVHHGCCLSCRVAGGSLRL